MVHTMNMDKIYLIFYPEFYYIRKESNSAKSITKNKYLR